MDGSVGSQTEERSREKREGSVEKVGPSWNDWI